MPIRELTVSLYSGTTTRNTVRTQKTIGKNRLSCGGEGEVRGQEERSEVRIFFKICLHGMKPKCK